MTDGGFTKIPHWLMSELYRSDLTGRELKVILYIIRDILGYHKTSQKIAYGRIAEATGIDRRSVIRVVQSLENKGWISVKRKDKFTNIVALKGGGKDATSTSGKKCHIEVASAPPIKDNPKSVTRDLRSFGERNPSNKDKLSLEELNNLLGEEYE